MAEVPPGPSSVLSPQGDTLSPFPGGGGGGGGPASSSSSSCSTSSAAAAACSGAQDEEAEEEEEEEEEGPAGGREQQRGGGGSSDGGKGGPQQQHRLHHHHHHPPHHNHQLNGLISPELRHLRASLKSKILGSEAGAAPEGLENKRASKTMGSGQQQQPSPPAAAPCSSPLPNHLPPQGRTAPSPPPSPAAAAATGDRSQPAATTTTAAKTAARNGLAGGTGLEEEEQEEGDEGGEEEESLLLLSRSLAAGCSLKGSGTDSQPEEDLTIRYVRYESELQMPDIMRLITKDLSEPYSIYTYRYFIHNWPQLCFLELHIPISKNNVRLVIGRIAPDPTQSFVFNASQPHTVLVSAKHFPKKKDDQALLHILDLFPALRKVEEKEKERKGNRKAQIAVLSMEVEQSEVEGQTHLLKGRKADLSVLGSGNEVILYATLWQHQWEFPLIAATKLFAVHLMCNAMVGEECVGAIVCKLDMHKKMFRRGYIAMLAVDSKYRRKGIGTNLVKKAIYAMVEGDCDEVVLETEITNKSALKLYENLGFVRDKRLFRYYLNGVDALRLKLWLR